MKLENEDDQLMAIAAHSYCLGRPTYMGRACVQWVMRTWPQMTEKTKLVILRETVDALTNNRVVGERIANRRAAHRRHQGRMSMEQAPRVEETSSGTSALSAGLAGKSNYE